MYSRFFSHSPFSAQLSHIWTTPVHFFLVFLVFSVYPTNACSRYSYWWWWLVPSLRPPLLPTKLRLASTRTKRDSGRCRCPPGGENHPGERKKKRKRKKALPRKGKGEPARKLIRSISYTRGKREREREKKSLERAGGNAERGGRVTVDFADVFPDKSIVGKNITREERSSFREK